MPINIHGKEYFTVAERVQKAHANKDLLAVSTEVLRDTPVVIKATITTKTGVFTGISAADAGKPIEKKSPYEVAETSAVGRALAFSGYVGSEIASYDELVKAEAVGKTKRKVVNTDEPPFSEKARFKEGELTDEMGL